MAYPSSPPLVTLSIVGDSAELPAPGERLRIEHRRVGPKFATAVLEQRNNLNRNVSDSIVANYAAQMRRGAWKLTHQGIAFDTHGALIDGQHRLFAVVDAGVEVEMLVHWNMSEEARGVVDSGKARQVGDQLRMLHDLPYGKLYAAAYTVVRALDAGDLKNSITNRLDYDVAKDLHLKYGRYMDQLIEKTSASTLMHVGSKPVGALCWAMKSPQVDVDKHLVPFLEQLAWGEGLHEGDPAYYARDVLQGNRARNRGSRELAGFRTLVTLVCLRAVIERKQVRLVRIADYHEGGAGAGLLDFYATGAKPLTRRGKKS